MGYRGVLIKRAGRNVRFSNWPFGVKRFQTIHQHSVDVAHGLVLLFGIGAKALPSWDSKTRRNNLWDGLAVSVTAGPSGHTISPHPSSREGHHSTARWNSSFLLSHLIPHRRDGVRCRNYATSNKKLYTCRKDGLLAPTLSPCLSAWLLRLWVLPALRLLRLWLETRHHHRYRTWLG